MSLNNAISAVNFEHDTNVAVNHSTFQNFHHAVQDYENNGFTASYNSFSMIYDDGIRNGGTSNVNIQHNTFTDFHMDPTDLDHPDTIQFWTNGETTSASNIYIAYNTYTRGAGNPVQGIFMRDEVGTLPYLNVNIIGNNYAGALYSGIRVIDGHGVNIDNNILPLIPI